MFLTAEHMLRMKAEQNEMFGKIRSIVLGDCFLTGGDLAWAIQQIRLGKKLYKSVGVLS